MLCLTLHGKIIIYSYYTLTSRLNRKVAPNLRLLKNGEATLFFFSTLGVDGAENVDICLSFKVGRGRILSLGGTILHRSLHIPSKSMTLGAIARQLLFFNLAWLRLYTGKSFHESRKCSVHRVSLLVSPRADLCLVGTTSGLRTRVTSRSPISSGPYMLMSSPRSLLTSSISSRFNGRDVRT